MVVPYGQKTMFLVQTKVIWVFLVILVHLKNSIFWGFSIGILSTRVFHFFINLASLCMRILRPKFDQHWSLTYLSRRAWTLPSFDYVIIFIMRCIQWSLWSQYWVQLILASSYLLVATLSFYWVRRFLQEEQEIQQIP